MGACSGPLTGAPKFRHNLIYHITPILTTTSTSIQPNTFDKIIKMFATRPLFHAVRITLFHRDNCGLCHQAKGVLSNVWDKRHFDYTEVDLTKSEQWRNLYDFDIPVVRIPLFQRVDSIHTYTIRSILPKQAPLRNKSALPGKPSSSCIGSPRNKSRAKWTKLRSRNSFKPI